MNRPGSGADGSRSGKPCIVLSSRAAISRNLSNHKFPSSCSTEEKNRIIAAVKKSTAGAGELKELCFMRLSRMSGISREILLGDYQIEDDFISSLAGRGILVLPRPSLDDPATSVPLCWNDHLRIQSASPGNSIDAVFSTVSDLEKLFESRLNFSFSKEWGYMTSNPAMLGTALEISLLVHLPALTISPDITEFIKNLSKVGCSVEGYSGSNSEITGNIFKISSLKTLGKSEEEIVEEMNAICLNIVDEEESARKKLVIKDRLGAKDNVLRSYGLLKYARILSFEEALELLSILRLGIDLGIIDNIRDFDFFKIINMIGDAHLISSFEMGDKAGEDDIDLKRAWYIRDAILGG